MKVTKTDQKLNNKGFSLVELIVVISIMAVMVGFVSIGTGILSGKRAKEARDKLLSSLENVRTQTMGKDSIDATLSYDSASGQYILTYVINKDKNAAAGEDEDSGTKVICGSSCIIYYAYDDLSGDVSTAEKCAANTTLHKVKETSLEFSFDRSNGALKANAGGNYVEHIYIVQGNHDPFGIRIYPETGKITEE